MKIENKSSDAGILCAFKIIVPHAIKIKVPPTHHNADNKKKVSKIGRFITTTNHTVCIITQLLIIPSLTFIREIKCIPYFVLLYLCQISLHVSCYWLRLHLPDPPLCARQPIGELLELLLLKVHQNLMKPEDGGDREVMFKHSPQTQASVMNVCVCPHLDWRSMLATRRFSQRELSSVICSRISSSSSSLRWPSAISWFPACSTLPTLLWWAVNSIMKAWGQEHTSVTEHTPSSQTTYTATRGRDL